MWTLEWKNKQINKNCIKNEYGEEGDYEQGMELVQFY